MTATAEQPNSTTIVITVDGLPKVRLSDSGRRGGTATRPTTPHQSIQCAIFAELYATPSTTANARASGPIRARKNGFARSRTSSRYRAARTIA